MTMPHDEHTPDFADLGIDPRVLHALTDAGYETPSPIQAATIPALLAGRHVVGLAQTGTGKTAAFAVPILSRIDLEQRPPQALILTPTRELALQVAEAFGRYAHYLAGLHVLPIYGGQAYGVQLAGLRRGAHVVVGTPGRVIDHLQKKTLDLSHLRFLVLDEADEMLQMGFQEDVETILAETPAGKQVALFSATMPAQIRRLSAKYLTDPAEITVRTKSVTAANTRQRYIQVAQAQKMDALTRVLEVEKFDGMIIFVRTKQATEALAERLRSRGFSAAAINGDLVQAQRERTIAALRTGEVDLLVATDVAARGLDVDRISHVLNYDIPADPESYVHRVGRTGRAGRDGEALLFVTPRERQMLGAIEKATRQPITQMALPSVEDVNAQRVAKFSDAITDRLAAPGVALFRQLISDYETEHDVPVIDIAAALAALSQDGRSFLLQPDPVPARPVRDPDRAAAPTRGGRVAGAPRRPPARVSGSSGFATYRIRVGHRHKVQPGAIVGALANEGGLSRADFGHIDIQLDHSLVELPAELPAETIEALRRTRISGQLIELSRADGSGPGSAGSAQRHDPSPRAGKPARAGGLGSSRATGFGGPPRATGGAAKRKKPKPR